MAGIDVLSYYESLLTEVRCVATLEPDAMPLMAFIATCVDIVNDITGIETERILDDLKTLIKEGEKCVS